MVKILLLSVCASILSPTTVYGVCPFLQEGTPPSNSAPVPSSEEYDRALSGLDITAVLNDIDALLTSSQECWPADTFNSRSSYAPLFVRLGWHCSGSFRATDGAGGCSGGRQRFWPEASWDDNTNLDKARALLAPIKNKYGMGLSWGDLMIFAASTSIVNMGGPITEICAGRVDSNNGSLSEPLGPGPQQPACDVNGECTVPLGTDTVGLIYVNPGGVMGIPDPTKSAPRIREVFSRMGMDDTETVALIGGGHAFGKSHGACPDGPGAPPNDSPNDPWPGKCGTGKGADTFTSGFEGQWTTNPLQWDNEYFQQLINDEYTLINGSGDKPQWKNKKNGFMMLTTDYALVFDDEYKKIVTQFAEDIDALEDAFSNAWAKLTTSGGSWSPNKRCINPNDLPTSTTSWQSTKETTKVTAKVSNVSDNEATWRIVGIVFSALFAVALFIIGYLVYGRCANKEGNPKDKYQKL